MPTARALAKAGSAVRAHLAPSPLLASPALGANVWLKLESAQPTGSFKVRGALAALSARRPDTTVITASAGNHALAVAWASQRLGRPSVVVVPENASPAKLDGLTRFAVDVRRHGRSFDDAERHAFALVEGAGEYLSAYNDPELIAGQASIGDELPDRDPRLTVVCPVGGGGLLAGLCVWAAEKPDVRLIGVEADASRAVSVAVREGRVVPVDVGPTLADGLAGNIEPNAITWQIIARRVDDLLTVSEGDIVAAVRFLAREHGLVAEGAGAVATAAMLSGRLRQGGCTVALVTGRNIALDRLAHALGEVEP